MVALASDVTKPLVFFSPHAAPAVLLLQQLKAYQSQDLSWQKAAQFTQLKILLAHAWRYSPFWKTRLGLAGYEQNTITSEFLQTLPILSRQEVQHQYDAMCAPWPGQMDDDLFTVSSSGSTGKPVRVQKSRATQNPLDGAYALLELEWHKTNPQETIAFIGFGIRASGRPAEQSSWGGIFKALHYRGRLVSRDIGEGSLESHLEWLIKEKPSYLKASPFLAAQLARLALETGVKLCLKAIISQSEKVSAVHRELCFQVFGAKIIDRYSSEETGLIALQCPTHNHQHVMSSSMLVEIVDEQGIACSPGEVGRVLVTNLVGYAMPLIRYDLGDFAQWGPPCNCGIRLPVISKLWGRVRNTVIHADGSAHLMGFLGDELGLVENVLEFKIVQYAGNELRLELVCRQVLTQDQIAQIRQIFANNGLSGLWLFIKEVPRLPDLHGRKREEFERVDKVWTSIDQDQIKILI